MAVSLSSMNPKGRWAAGGREVGIDALISGKERWDVVIVGGGITGAGILLECARRGLKALLLEKHDFSYGSSSKSSKMVHGGLRYLAAGQYGLTRDSVRERQRLMDEAGGLVDPLGFLMGHYQGEFPPGFLFEKVLNVYDFIAGKRQHKRYPARDAQFLAPGICPEKLESISQFTDAVTDDSRLVLRVLHEALAKGCQAYNYCAVEAVQRSNTQGALKGPVDAVQVKDLIGDRTFEVPARVVINATGAWADELRIKEGEAARMRPLRGSHLVIPQWRIPVAFSVSYFHPQDKRPVFVFPWEGVTVIGTTDLDHSQDMDQDARITSEEVVYLLTGLNRQFPGLGLTTDDVLCTWSGVRPVVGSGEKNPSKEKREHSVWDDQGLITVAGGKLTTFRLIALDVLKHAASYLSDRNLDILVNRKAVGAAIFTETIDASQLTGIPRSQAQRFAGRFGFAARELASGSRQSLQIIGASKVSWAELEWSLHNEQVVHLDDLLLRRSRLGLLLPRGAEEEFDHVGTRCREVLGWSESYWGAEVTRYQKIYAQYFSLPAAPDDQANARDSAS